MAFDGVFTHYLIKELNYNLLNGRINKIYQVSNYELVFIIRANNKTQKLLLSIHPIFARVQITNCDFTYPQEPPLFCMVLRKHLEGAIINEIYQKDNDRIFIFDIEFINEIGDRDKKQLIVEVMGKHSNIILINKTTNTIIDCIKHISPFQNSYRTLQPGANYLFPPSTNKINFFKANFTDFDSLNYVDNNLEKQIVNTFEGVSPLLAKELLNNAHIYNSVALFKSYENLLKQTLEPTIINTPTKSYFYLFPLNSIEGETKSYATISEMLDRFYYNKDEQERIKQQTADLEKFIKSELEKNINKLHNLQTELNEAKNANIYKIYGDLILTYSYKITKGMFSCSVENYYEHNNLITIELDPLLTAIENAQKYFAKYQKAKKAVSHLTQQIVLTNDEIIYFETLYQQIQTATLVDALEIRSELEQGKYLKRNVTKHKKALKPQFETYIVNDAIIYVGKNNLQNDYLTNKFANKDDIWLHVKDMPGSHVIIKYNGNLTEEIIRTGANLAAYFSKGRMSSSVPVDYTKIKNVKKIPGAKLGFVTYDNHKTIYIDPNEDLVLSLVKKK